MHIHNLFWLLWPLHPLLSPSYLSQSPPFYRSLLQFLSFCFVLQATDSNQGYLCNCRTTHRNLIDSPWVDRQLKTMTLPSPESISSYKLAGTIGPHEPFSIHDWLSISPDLCRSCACSCCYDEIGEIMVAMSFLCPEDSILQPSPLNILPCFLVFLPPWCSLNLREK